MYEYSLLYTASSWKNVDIVRSVANCLKDAGHEVDDFTDNSKGRFVFSYLDLPGYQDMDGIEFLKVKQAQKAFAEDKKWIDWSDAVLLVLPAGRSAHLEAGYAVGRGKKLIVYGDFPTGEFDVMYGFANLLTREFDDVLRLLKKGE